MPSSPRGSCSPARGRPARVDRDGRRRRAGSPRRRCCSRRRLVPPARLREGVGAPVRAGFPMVRLGRARRCSALSLGAHGDATPNTLVHLYVRNVDDIATEFGVAVDEEGLAGRECELEDPDGNRLRIATPRSTDHEPALVSTPSAVVSDPEHDRGRTRLAAKLLSSATRRRASDAASRAPGSSAVGRRIPPECERGSPVRRCLHLRGRGGDVSGRRLRHSPQALRRRQSTAPGGFLPRGKGRRRGRTRGRLRSCSGARSISPAPSEGGSGRANRGRHCRAGRPLSCGLSPFRSR